MSNKQLNCTNGRALFTVLFNLQKLEKLPLKPHHVGHFPMCGFLCTSLECVLAWFLFPSCAYFMCASPCSKRQKMKFTKFQVYKFYCHPNTSICIILGTIQRYTQKEESNRGKKKTQVFVHGSTPCQHPQGAYLKNSQYDERYQTIKLKPHFTQF